MAITGPVSDVASFSFGAQFAEVHVDPVLRTIRVARMVGVVACGTIVNERTAHSNLAGGMVRGAGFALLEQSKVGGPQAKFANAVYNATSLRVRKTPTLIENLLKR